jgi:hypothetical protein
VTLSKGEMPVQEPPWFGPAEQPLFGWLTRPTNTMAEGGVVIALPIGRKAFAARCLVSQLHGSVSLGRHIVSAKRVSYERDNRSRISTGHTSSFMPYLHSNAKVIRSSPKPKHAV